MGTEERDERQQAADALAMVRALQQRAGRAARLPRWVYLAMFGLIAASVAVNDFIGPGGAAWLAVMILIGLVVVLGMRLGGVVAPLSWVRGVQARRQPSRRALVAALVVVDLGAWLIYRYGIGVTGDLANAVGLRHYPATVAGVVFGAAFTLLFAVSELLVTAASR